MESFFEQKRLERCIKRLGNIGSLFSYEVLGEVPVKGGTQPIYGLHLGSKDPKAPTFGLFGGVHGIERVGSHLIINYLNSFLYRLKWNTSFAKKLENYKIACIPIINPGGMMLGRRSNPNGVDLMRNAPVEAERRTLSIISGHRISSKIPWFRGVEGAPMEMENQILSEFVQKNLFQSKFSISLDVHSGYGKVDRVWYPYGKTKHPFPRVHMAKRVAKLMRLSNPFTLYKVEPQSGSYLLHGDVWDYLFDLHYENKPKDQIYIPWTLEMGSWKWILENPSMIFRQGSLFNPVLPNRYKKTMRRHWWLLDFFSNLTCNAPHWIPKGK